MHYFMCFYGNLLIFGIFQFILNEISWACSEQKRECSEFDGACSEITKACSECMNIIFCCTVANEEGKSRGFVTHYDLIGPLKRMARETLHTLSSVSTESTYMGWIKVVTA